MMVASTAFACSVFIPLVAFNFLVYEHTEWCVLKAEAGDLSWQTNVSPAVSLLG